MVRTRRWLTGLVFYSKDKDIVPDSLKDPRVGASVGKANTNWGQAHHPPTDWFIWDSD
jgi:hypothetical protein